MFKSLGSFSHSNRFYSARFGQRGVECAAVATSTWCLFFAGRLNNVTVHNVNAISRRINETAADHYRLGSIEEGNVGNDLVELSSIYHARTIDMRNILNVNPDLRIVFENATTALDDGNGNMRQMADFIDDYGTIDFASYFSRYMISHDNAVILSRSRRHYITVLKINERLLLIDGLDEFRFYEYNQLSTLVADVAVFFGLHGFSLHSARVFGSNEFDIIKEANPNANTLPTTSHQQSTSSTQIIDLISDDEEEEEQQQEETGEVISIESESENEEDDKTIDPTSVDVFVDADVIRAYLEEIVTERDTEKGRKYEVAEEGDRKCLVKACKNKPHWHGNARGFCSFHSSVGYKCISLVNGRICATDGCTNKSTIFNGYCGGCTSLGPDAAAREQREKAKRWTKEKVLKIANDIVEKYAQMVKKDPTILLYFGITIRSLHIRLSEHQRNGKDFDTAVLEIEVPDAHSLAELEFQVVARFAEIAGGRHLRNRTAGGDYYLPDMNRAGVLYVLIFFNRVTPQTPTPAIDFRSRRGYRHRAFNILTPRRHIELPRFNKIVGITEIMRKLGYDSEHNMRQAPRHREKGQKCDQCEYVATSMLALQTHMKVHRNKGKHQCPHCSHTATRLEHLRLHMDKVHGEIMPLAKRTKDEYPCDECSEVFGTSQERIEHKKKMHKKFVNCSVCKQRITKAWITEHMKNSHGQKKKQTDHQCSICQRFLASEASLYMHVR